MVNQQVKTIASSPRINYLKNQEGIFPKAMQKLGFDLLASKPLFN